MSTLLKKIFLGFYFLFIELRKRLLFPIFVKAAEAPQKLTVAAIIDTGNWEYLFFNDTFTSPLSKVVSEQDKLRYR